MTAGQRFQKWVEGLSEAWKVQLRGWMASWLGFGIEVFMDVLGKAAAPKLRPLIEKMEATGEVPEELKPLLEELKNPEGEFAAVMAQSMAGSAIGGAFSKILDVLFARMSYMMGTAIHPLILDPASIVALWRRGKIPADKLPEYLKKHGLDDDAILGMQQLSEQIAFANDIVRFAVREVYSPEVAEKFGQFQDFPEKAIPDAYKAGVDAELLKKYWAAHWDLPSPGQGFEMLHRGVVDEDTLKLLLRALDVMPYWRDKLISISWNIPTRVDVRRFWDMRTIDEARLRELYTAMGYHGKDLEDYILWTKVYSAFPDLIARWANGWITTDEVKAELTGLGMPAERVEEMIQTRLKAVKAERTSAERNLTKSDIIAGIQKGVVSRDEGLGLLGELGYDPDEAEFVVNVRLASAGTTEAVVKEKDLTKADILNAIKDKLMSIADGRQMLVDLGYSAQEADILIMVKLGVTSLETAPTLVAGASPSSLEGFRELTQSFRKAAGQEVKPMSEELKKAAAEVVRLTGEVKSLGEAVKEEQKGLVKAEPLPAEATRKLKELQTALHRAEAELGRVKVVYAKELARWRQGAK